MINDLKPYSEYRESATSWIGNIPSHWKVRRFKYILREQDLRSSDGKEQLLRVSQYTGVTQRLRSDGLDEPDTRADSLVGYKNVAPDDLVINIMLAWNGSLGVSRYNGIASPAYCVYRFGPEAYPWYYHHLLRSPAYKARIKAISTGVVESRLRLYTDSLYRLESLLPPPDEQAAIVRFLNHVNHRIERTIKAKRKVIALLNEQKQVIIHSAVTRGLDTNVKMKPSAISWLGDIPEHWEDLRSKYVFHEVDERSITGTETHLSMSQKYGLIPNSQIEERRLVSESYVGAKLCRIGDLVLNRLKAHLGVFALAPEPGLISPDYTVFRPARPMVARYFEAMYRTPACRVELRKRAKGIVQGFWRLYTDDFYDIRVPVPPLKEQDEIMQYLDKELSSINTVIAGTEREIDLLREYKTRLISDVVTGKLDVRQAAEELPNELESLDFNDSLDDSAEIDELDDGVEGES